MKYASVILDDNLEKPLDYLIPEELIPKIKPGVRVQIPVKNGLKKGYVFEIRPSTNIEKIKPIKEILSEEVIPKELFALAEWMSQYYSCSLSKILRNIIPSSIRKEIKPRSFLFLSLNQSRAESTKICSSLISKYPLQAQILELFIKAPEGILLTNILKITNSSKSPIDSLIKKKILKATKIGTDESSFFLDLEYFQTKPKELSKEQKSAYDKIVFSLESSSFATHLIHGVTGSGKTEIYLQAIQKALDLNKSSIMLVPEIALTSQTIERFKSRFEEKIAVIHHRRSLGERFEAWHQILQGKAKIVIGARSAIFSPLKNLGLIIVDEEHDTSYKQAEEQPSYHARNVAVIRGKFSNATVILGSATPSLESYFNAERKKYILSTLPNRVKKSSLPEVHIIDMRIEVEKNKGYTHFSEKLLTAIKKRYENGEQTILFLNRRGYNNFLICLNCSGVIKCPHCDLSLTFHKRENLLSCHSCDYKIPHTPICPICQKTSQFQYKGFGTEHVEASLKAIFPDIRTLRVDRDTTMTKNSHETLFKEFKSGKADVLIGTQMIVKGLHFPSVTLVGVLNSDGALNIPDFRSSEVVFQLITQVAGRSGRADLKGEVIIQTFMPDNPIISLASKQDFLAFYHFELEARKKFDYPPFTSMIKINFFGPEELEVKEFAEKFRVRLIEKLSSDSKIHPVIPSGRVKIKDKFRFHLLIRGKKISSITKEISCTKEEVKKPPNVNIFIDVDPTNIFF
jgi:primosomal protein N' (replication factor Y) (superfamily II helicase)